MIIINIIIVLEVLAVVLEIKKNTLLLVIVYCMPSPLGTFIEYFILLTKKFPTQNSNQVGDFNLDHMLPENVAKVHLLIQNFNLS